MEPSPADWDYAARIADAKARIHVAEAACGRAGAGVRLLVATKAWGPDAASAVVRAGGTLVGESRMQELEAKGPALIEAGAKIHVIGQLQRNKAATAVRYAAVRPDRRFACARRAAFAPCARGGTRARRHGSGQRVWRGNQSGSGTRGGTCVGVGHTGFTRAYGDRVHDYWAQLTRGGPSARGLRTAA